LRTINESTGFHRLLISIQVLFDHYRDNDQRENKENAAGNHKHIVHRIRPRQFHLKGIHA
jgi:hypothetical protein